MNVARLIEILKEARPDAEVMVGRAGEDRRLPIQVVDIADHYRHDGSVVIVGGPSPYPEQR